MKIVLHILILISIFGCAKKLEDSDVQRIGNSTEDESQNLEGISETEKQLKLAIETSSDNLVRYALKSGANPNKIYIGDETALSYSIKKYQNTITRLLINHGANPNKQNRYGEYPLHISVDKINLAATNILLNSTEINKNVLNSHGDTAVISSAKSRNRQLTLLLISKKLNLSIKSSEGSYIDEIAELNFDKDLSILIKDLRLYQDDVTKYSTLKSIIENNRKSSMLYIRNMYWDQKIEISGAVFTTTLDLQDISQKSFYIDSLFKLAKFKVEEVHDALMYAARINDMISFKNLYTQTQNFDPNSLDNSNRTPLTYAAENLNYQFAYYLRQKGADTYYEDKDYKVRNSCNYIRRNGQSRRAVRSFKKLLGC